MDIKVRMRCVGVYEIDTPSGTYRLVRAEYDKFSCAGITPVKWLLQNPGEYSADSDFFTKRDAVAYVRTVEGEKIVNVCTAHNIKDERKHLTSTLTVPKCEAGERYGVWDELAGGFVYVVDCAIEAANWAVGELRSEPDSSLSVEQECKYHEEEIAGQCEGCNAIDSYEDAES